VNFLVANALSCVPTTAVWTLMSDAEQRDIAEALFEPKQSREEIKGAIKLEEARRAAMVKNLYRLRSLRLSRKEASTQSEK
jgi:tRNA A37 threonylcarbamoyladenosine synthetase subunit TsaC/SUA5/YrdC